MNYERLRKNIVGCLYTTEITIIADEIIKHVKAEIECCDLPEIKSTVKIRSLMLQVNEIFQKWLNDSSVCCTNSEDKRNFYNAYWQEIVDIVKQSLTKEKE